MRRTLLLLCLPILACSDTPATNDGGADGGRDAAKDTGAVTDATMDGPATDSGSDSGPASDSGADSGPGADAASDSGADAAADSGADAAADSGPADSGPADSGPADSGGGSVWATPTCDGTIGANEYGPAQNAFTTNGMQTWSMTWNATNLYVGLTNAAVTEAVVLYVGYGGMNFLTAGQTYDNTRPSSLIFNANAVVYAKKSYNEVRIVSNNVWTVSNGNVTFCDSGQTRELVIPWSLLGANGRPASFRWVGYVTSNSGFVYAQVPQSNPSGNIGTNATFPNDYFVSSTANGSGAFPFATIE
jgi:hypothetical protein